MKNSILVLLLVVVSLTNVQSQTCKTYTFSSSATSKTKPATTNYTTCADLPVLDSYLHWTYDPSTTTLLIAYRHTNLPTRKWVSWAINPLQKGMVGCQSVVAYPKADGSMAVYTSPITSYGTSLPEGKLSGFNVTELSGVYENGEIVIFATIQGMKNGNSVNHVWQDGLLSDDTPEIHLTSGDNMKSMGTLNLLSGVQSTETGSTPAAEARVNKIIIHAVLNTLSWGTIMIVLVIVARFFRFLEHIWFYIHGYGQLVMYTLAAAGFVTGIQLGNNTPGVEHTTHRCIGIAVFCFATLQACAILIRPKKDHKYRFYWNVYHHSIGYSALILGVINVFEGIAMVRPDPKWKNAYIGVLVVLGFVAVVLQAIAWYSAFKEKKSELRGKPAA